jgi:hypothetical protein
MPGTYMIDSAQTFSAVLLLSCTRRTKFGSDEADFNAYGVPKWTVEAVCTFMAEPDRKASSEVVQVSIAAQTDPAEGITPGSPVILEGLRVGVSTPEKRDNGRISGGRAWMSATGVRPASPVPNGRPMAGAGAKSE